MICPVLEPFQGTWNGVGRVERLTRIGIMRFEELLERWQKGSLSHAEVAPALGVSERTLRRWRQRYEEDGADGLVDRRVGQPSPRLGARGRARAHACTVPGKLSGLHDQAFPREAGEAPRLQARLHYDPDLPAKDRDGGAGAEARCPSAQAAAPADARHDATSGWLEARLARRPAGARPDHHHG